VLIWSGGLPDSTTDRWVLFAMAMLIAGLAAVLARALVRLGPVADAGRHPTDRPDAPEAAESLEERGHADPVAPDRRERLELVGRLTGRFTHEFNNQLGVISNSAYLIQRRAQDPRLQLPVQAMLRAVDAFSLLSQKLQGFAEHREAAPQLVELQSWLDDNTFLFGNVLGKQAKVMVSRGSSPLWVNMDPAVLDMMVTHVLLQIRETMGNAVQVMLAASALQAMDERGLDADGHYAELEVDAMAVSEAESPSAPDPGAPARGSLGWQPIAATEAALQWLGRTCSTAGGGAWFRDHGVRRHVGFSLVFLTASSAPDSARKTSAPKRAANSSSP